MTAQADSLTTVRLALDAGQAVLLNTDTLPGLHARIDRPQGLAAVQQLKGRDASKPLLVLAASVEAAGVLMAPLAAWQEAYLSACWPGPFTLIVTAAAEGLAGAIRASGGTVAVRVPDRSPLLALLAETGPLASTSANRAGHQPASTLDQARSRFPDLLSWDDGGGDSSGSASALVDLTGEGPRVLRPGPLTAPTV